jgi:hypothetical protein
MNRSRILIGLVLIAVGVVFLLDSTGVLAAGRVIASWWPVVIIAVGAAQLLDRPRPVAGALLVMAVGGVLLAVTLGALTWGTVGSLWPLALVVVGVWLLVGHLLPGGRELTADQVDLTAILGGRELAVRSKAFTGGSITAILGGVDLDLTHSTVHPDGGRLSVTAILGGAEIVVPPGVRVVSGGPVLLGGIEDKTQVGQPLPDDAPLLELRMFVALGGVEVKAARVVG